MKIAVAAAAAVLAFSSAGFAQERSSCSVPSYMLSSDSQLHRVSNTVIARREFVIAVVGTGSSALAGPDGPRSAYPARLEAVLSQKLSGIPVNVVTLVRSRQTVEDLAKGMGKLLVDE